MASTTEGVLLASGARTTTQTLAPGANLLTPMGAPTLIEVTVDLTAFTTAASLTPSIQVWDIAKGDYITVLTGAAIAATGTVTLRYGAVAIVTNLSATGVIPKLWRVVITHGNGNSHTYSVSGRVLAE